MPVVVTSPYDSVEYVLNLARAMVNDTAQSLGGNVLSDVQPYTGVYLNLAWRRLQKKLTNVGVETFVKEIILTPVTPVTPIDPATQVFISFTGYFNGTSYSAVPFLPADMVGPLVLHERPTGSVSNFNRMYPVNDGLPSRAQTGWLYEHEWRNDQIFFCGALQSVDVKLRYNAWLQDLVVPTPGQESPTVPVLRCAEALAAYTGAAFAAARGSPAADSLITMGDGFVKDMTLQTSRKKQRGNHRRIGYSRRGRQGWGFW